MNAVLSRTLNGFSVKLNNKILQTPLKNELLIPLTKQKFASKVLNELNQVQGNNRPSPAVALAVRALDHTKEQRNKETVKLMNFLDTDTLLVFSPKTDCKGQLRAQQEQLFHPIINETQQKLNLTLSWLNTEHKMYGNFQTPETKHKVTEWLTSLDNWQFSSLELATVNCKSMLLGIKLVLDSQCDPINLSELSLLDTKLQTDIWGYETVYKQQLAALIGIMEAAYAAVH